MKVKAIDGERHKRYRDYPPAGTVGKIVFESKSKSAYMVQWPQGSTSECDRWWCDKNLVKIVKE